MFLGETNANSFSELGVASCHLSLSRPGAELEIVDLGFEVGDLEFEIEALCQNQAQAVSGDFPLDHIVFLGETNANFFLNLALHLALYL